jgi:hypothetical protein
VARAKQAVVVLDGEEKRDERDAAAAVAISCN